MNTAPRPDGTTIGRIKQAFGCANEDAGLWMVYKYDLSEAWVKATDGQTLLMDVCQAGNLKAARYLIEKGREDLHAKTGYSELQISIFGNNRPTEGKLSPIFFAAKSGNAELIRYLASKGAMVNARSNYGTTPLMHAVTAQHVNAVKMLIALKANVHAQMYNNLSARDMVDMGAIEEISTALSRARKTGNEEIIEILIKAGAR
jgi:ankyrin repeat protein